MSEIFISYKREERHKAQAIAETLVTRGYNLWWDIELLPGDRFADEIAAVIEHAKAAIVLWSEIAVKSNFVRAEAAKASDRDILIPVRLDNCELPLPFGTIHTLDLRNWDGSSGDPLLDPLISAVEKKIDHIPTPVESPRIVQEILERPKGEVTFWRSVSERVPQEIKEYEAYISRYGDNAIFFELAIIRIEKLRSTEGKEKKSRLENSLGGASTKTPSDKQKSKHFSESSRRLIIVVAIIGLIGILGTAIINNWDKFFSPSLKPSMETSLPQPTPTKSNSPSKIDKPAIQRPKPQPSAPAVKVQNINGLWRDSNYSSNTSQVTQDGNRFHFTRRGILPNGTRFESSGIGTLTGQRYTSHYNAKYQSGAVSTGDCSGAVSRDGMHIDLNCKDSLLGSVPITADRE